MPIDPFLELREAPTLVHLLARRLESHPGLTVYTYLDEKGAESGNLGYDALLLQAAGVAEKLEREGVRRGDRVLLAFPPSGLELVASFWGCQLIGAVAVPVASPDPRDLERQLPVLRHIAANCGAKVALTHSMYRRLTQVFAARDAARGLFRGKIPSLGDWPDVRWVPVDGLSPARKGAADRLLRDALDRTKPDDIAFLQYTSGSTSNPKGVVVRHRNVMHNVALIARNSGLEAGSVMVGWVPLYHDMGLTGGILAAAFAGVRCVFFSPLTFLKRPELWLEAITRYRGTHAAGPNFGYEYMLRAVKDPSRYDLRTWKAALQGGEAMRMATVEKVAKTLAPAGFRAETFSNIYGMAETVLFVTGAVNRRPTILHVDKLALERDKRVMPREAAAQGETATLIGCGAADSDLGVEVVAVDPETRERLPEGRVGELWLHSPSNATGYFGWSDAENAERFAATVAGETNGRTYLRTGDLGFLHRGEVFLCGRHKDLMIFAGRNVYPEDVEQSVEGCHAILRRGNAAAFSVEVQGQEGLVLVLEVKGAPKPDESADAVAAIRDALAHDHQLHAHEIVLIEPRTMARTSSGKIQRSKCRQLYLGGQLRTVHRTGPTPSLAPTAERAEQPRIAIVGGGAAGLTAAWELGKRGYRDITIYEADDEVGGKVCTVEHEGRTFELGQLYLSVNYRICLELVEELGLSAPAEMPDFRTHTGHEVVGTDAAPFEARSFMLKALAAAGLDPEASLEDGFDHLRRTCTLPITEWLRQHEVPMPPDLVTWVWAGYGYGLLTDDVPAWYFLSYIHVVVTISARIPGGNRQLWTRLAEKLEREGVRIERATPITGLRRAHAGTVTVESAGGDSRSYDKVILACPVSTLRELLDPSDPRREWVDALETYDYLITVAEIDGLPRNREILAKANVERGRTGHVLGVGLAHSDTDFYLLAQYGTGSGEERLSDEELDRRMRADVRGMGGEVRRVVDRRRWQYFPHVSAKASPDLLDRFEARQGLGGLYFVGSYTRIETLEHTASSSRAMVRRHFPTVADPISAPTTRAPADGHAGERSTEAIEDMIRAEVAEVLKRPVESIDVERPLSEQGFQSVDAIELMGALEDALGRPMPPNLPFDHPTIRGLASALASLHPRPLARSVARPALRASAAAERDDRIAIVGMACRFPGAETPAELWRTVLRDEGVFTDVPSVRWDKERFSPEVGDRKIATARGGFLEGFADFDPGVFGIPEPDAASLDPQQRLLLECAWESLEDARIAPSARRGTATGVFVGLCALDHLSLAMGDEDAIEPGALVGSAPSTAAGRISHALGLEGPSMSIDAACASSLVAVHLACQALAGGECDLALAGGVNLVLRPNTSVYFSKLGLLSKNGDCLPFSAEADGYVRGDGCGVLVLKPLWAAQRDGDPIRAVIRGSAVGQNGVSQGLTAPNGPAQQKVIRAALARAKITPSELDHVECHATATPLGDAIEVQALGAVLREDGERRAPCVIGSIKGHVGHTEGAAGVASILKTVLALENEILPKSRVSGAPNPHVPWDDLPLRIARETQPWPRSPRRRIAGVSAFGFNGTNAHVVIEEAPDAPRAPDPSDDVISHCFVLSARDDAALVERCTDLATHLRSLAAAPGLRDLAFSLGTTRAHQRKRLAVVAGSLPELVGALEEVSRGELPANVRRASVGARRTAVDESLSLLEPDRLAECYVGGAEIDFQRLFTDGGAPRPRRLALPLYPFQHRRYYRFPGGRRSVDG